MADSRDDERIQLSDGRCVWGDFTVANGPLSLDQLLAIRDYLGRDESEWVELSREVLNTHLPTELSINSEAAISLFTGFRQAGIATESSAGRTYADYDFEVDVDSAIDLIDQQLIAKKALEQAAADSPDSTDVRLVFGLPPHLKSSASNNPNVTQLGPRLRTMLFNADEIVRIANPYFDTSEVVISDLASLPKRGIDTRLLTRQYDTNYSTREALRRVVKQVGEESARNFTVKDLYKVDESSGEHAYAVHAKVVISDKNKCYIGSANLMQTGLSANFELGVLLEGPIVENVIEIFDIAFEAAEPKNINTEKL